MRKETSPMGNRLSVGSRPGVRPAGLERLDPGALVRGCARGFGVLVVGGLVAPLAARIPVVGAYWLIFVAVVAFAVAGVVPGRTPRPGLQGLCAALGSYFLVLPLVVAASGGRVDPWQFGATTLTAVVVGGTSSLVAARLRQARA